MIIAKMDLLMKKLEASRNMEIAKIMAHTWRAKFAVIWVIRAMIALKQGKKPASSTMAITTGSATTTTTIKGGTRGPTSCSTIKMEVTILTCHTWFYKENRMHLICALGSELHTW
jgi:hypothetical protein